MQELKKLSLAELIDLLAEHTSNYTKLLYNNAPKEQLQNCRELVKEIQLEIETKRRANDKGSSSSLPADADLVPGYKNFI